MKCSHGINCDGECKNPNIDNGLMTKVWGPAGWLFLHCITFGYPYAINPNNPDHDNKKSDYKQFFELLGKVFPCKYCRESYQVFIKELPIDKYLNTRKDLITWLYKIHNKVNNKLGVNECNIPTLKEVNDKYETYRAQCKKTTEEERMINQAKGCIKPADGTPKQCVINIVPCKNGDITRRANPTIDIRKILYVSLILILGYLIYKKMRKGRK